MPLFPYKTIIVYDTEYTTWEGAQERDWSGLNEYREIVQFGAVCVDTTDFSETDSFSVLVKPVKNPKLSDFFIELTGISQHDVDTKGISFSDALEQFFQWTGGLHLYSYGRDALVLRENAKLLGVSFPFSDERFYNAREIFRAHGIDDTKYMSSTIVEAFGKSPTRRGHDSLNDARTLTQGLSFLEKRIKRRES